MQTLCHFNRRALLPLVFCALLTGTVGGAPPKYIFQDLGTLPNTSGSIGNGISAVGQVVGSCGSLSGSHGFLSANNSSSLDDLGTVAGATSTDAKSVSANGQVVGIARYGNGIEHAFWRPANGASLVDLGTLPGFNYSYAFGVSNSGQVVGHSFNAGQNISTFRAFVSAPNGGALTDIGTLPGGGSCFATAISPSGRITGRSQTSPEGYDHAFLTDATGGNMKDLGVLAPFGSFTEGRGVNDGGQVVGFGNAAGGFHHAFVSAPDGGPLTDLGILPGGFDFSEARAINSTGDIVGQAAIGTGEMHAILYTAVNGMQDLNDLIDPSTGFTLSDATGINDHGQIAGTGRYSPDGPTHAYLLTPGTPEHLTAAVAFTGGSPSNGTGGASFYFESNTDIKITHFGVWDNGDDGLTGDTDVRIYRTFVVSELVANALIPAGTAAPLTKGFRYVPLSTPVLITAGSSYLNINSYGPDPVITNPSSVTLGPEISAPNVKVGPNFLYTTDPLSNSDFEVGPFTTIGTVTHWTVTGNVTDTTEGSTGGTHGAAFSVGADSEGDTLSQYFFATPNQRYTIDFDSGVFGQRSGNPLQLNVKVVGNSTVLNETVTPPYAGTFNPQNVAFQHYQLTFVADTPTSNLTFSDLGLGNTNADVILDKVSIATVSPSYSQWQALYFTDDQQNDLTISGWNADPDGDGVPNGLEFYFNSNPIAGMTNVEQAGLPRITVQPSVVTFDATLTYRRRIGAGGLVGSSTNLQTWSEQASSQPPGTSVPTGDGVTEIFTTHTYELAPAFFRLTVGYKHPRSATQWSSSTGGNDHWYEVITALNLNWARARDYAVDRGGYLATISSAAENDFIKSLVPTGANPFIGGYKDNTGWHWVTGEPFAYTNWDAGEPNNFGGIEDRLQFLGASGTWNDTQRTNTDTFVIEYPQ